jgi:NADP-dependent 3-hydroxy acid dehydrogenase YdfG
MTSPSRERKIAAVTGASAGIGAATARALAAAGWEVVAGARRLDRLRQVSEPIGAHALALDVTDDASVARFADALLDRCGGRLDLLVNNAGGALGLDRVETADLARGGVMYETNVLGVVRLTKALLPALRAARGHVVNVGSVSGFEVYRGGGGYTASKHALRAVNDTLRLELLGQPVRVTEIDPGLVESEFALVRFDGDRERAAAVYSGMEPLTPQDVAECIVWAAGRPPRVNVDRIVVRPLDQATATEVHRQP